MHNYKWRIIAAVLFIIMLVITRILALQEPQPPQRAIILTQLCTADWWNCT